MPYLGQDGIKRSNTYIVFSSNADKRHHACGFKPAEHCEQCLEHGVIVPAEPKLTNKFLYSSLLRVGGTGDVTVPMEPKLMKFVKEIHQLLISLKGKGKGSLVATPLGLQCLHVVEGCRLCPACCKPCVDDHCPIIACCMRELLFGESNNAT